MPQVLIKKIVFFKRGKYSEDKQLTTVCIAATNGRQIYSPMFSQLMVYTFTSLQAKNNIWDREG